MARTFNKLAPLMLAVGALGTVAAATFFGASGCDQIKLGQAGSNDFAPTNFVAVLGSGQIIATTAPDPSQMGGVATVYDMGGGNYVIFLAGFQTNVEAGQLLRAIVNGSVTTIAALKSSSGNQRYNFTLAGGSPTFSMVSIFSTKASQDYGQAVLTH